MEKLFLVIFAAALVGACGSDSSSSGSGGSGGAGTGGSSTGGTASGGTAGTGTGGAAGSTGGSAGASGNPGTGGAAGSAGTGGAAGSGGAAGTGGKPGDAGACAPLFDTYQKALAEAVKCSSQLGVVQCSGSATLYDSCGCKLVANETQDAKVKEAQAAYDAWTKAGCGPYGCGKACFEGTTGACDPTTSTCTWK
jgi:hypothetical protein